MRVGKATGSRECAPDDRLRVPTFPSAHSEFLSWARRKRAFAHPPTFVPYAMAFFGQ
jgi:hypothetical protein